MRGIREGEIPLPLTPSRQGREDWADGLPLGERTKVRAIPLRTAQSQRAHSERPKFAPVLLFTSSYIHMGLLPLLFSVKGEENWRLYSLARG